MICADSLASVPRLLFFAAVLALPLLVLMVMYNGHVGRRNAVDHAFSSIDVQLKKRWDLIPRLVETVKGYAKHEQDLLERVTKARERAQHAPHQQRFLHEGELSQQLPRVCAIAEAYPELKADAQFTWLQRNLTEVESQISAARRAYNAAVTAYNDGVQMFPSSIVAGMFGFERREWFQLQAGHGEVPNVRL